MSEQHLPFSKSAEEAVLGAMIVDPSKIEAARLTGLTEADFYDAGRGWVYRALRDLEACGPDYITLCDLLSRRSQLSELGGPPEITRLITTCVTSVHAVHYANVVRAYALRRRFVQAGTLIAQAAYAGKLDSDPLRHHALHLIDAALKGNEEALKMPKPKTGTVKEMPPALRIKGIISDRKRDLD